MLTLESFLDKDEDGLLCKVYKVYAGSLLKEEYKTYPKANVGSDCLKKKYTYTGSRNTTESCSIGTWEQYMEDAVGAVTDPFENTKSIAFDGINDYINVDNGSTLNIIGDEPKSISLWFKRGSTGTNQIMLGKETIAPTRKGWFVAFVSDKLNFHLRDDAVANTRIKVDSNATYTDSDWHHFVVTYDGSLGGGGVTMYLDGVSIASTIVVNTLTANTTGNSVDFKMGTRDALDLPYSGQLDEVSIWRVELTPADVTEIYNMGVPVNLLNVDAAADLEHWWRMGDLDVYPSVADHKSTADGTMTNMAEEDIVDDVPD